MAIRNAAKSDAAEREAAHRTASLAALALLLAIVTVSLVLVRGLRDAMAPGCAVSSCAFATTGNTEFVASR